MRGELLGIGERRFKVCLAPLLFMCRCTETLVIFLPQAHTFVSHLCAVAVFWPGIGAKFISFNGGLDMTCLVQRLGLPMGNISVGRAWWCREQVLIIPMARCEVVRLFICLLASLVIVLGNMEDMLR